MDRQTHSFTTTNPDHLEFKYQDIDISVLGGIRLDGLDRMRATLCIEIGLHRLRQNLDLYNDNQVEKLVRKVAQRFEVGTVVVGVTLGKLIDVLEEYRLEKIESLKTSKPEPKPLTKEEREDAIKYLKGKKLMKRTMEDIGKAGVIGEDLNRLLMYLVFTSRKRRQPLHIISHGTSGQGKSHLQEKVSSLIPEEDIVNMTSMSENSLYYFGRHDLQHKLITIEDMDGADGALYPIREIETKGTLSKTIVEKAQNGATKVRHLVVEGPVSIAGCTTKEKVYEDNSNRSFLIHIDESFEQDDRIMAYQRLKSAGKVNDTLEKEMRERFKNMQRVLEPITVRNPLAEFMQLPREVFKPRRTNAHYLAFVETVTYYHQFQREQKVDEDTGEIYIETTVEDIEEANKLMKDVLLRKSDELSGATRNYLELVKAYLKTKKKKTFSNAEVRQVLRVTASSQKRYNSELFEYDYLRRKGNRALGYTYQLNVAIDFPNLQLGVERVLDAVIQKIKSQN